MADSVFIPKQDSHEYREYLNWCEKGNTPIPYNNPLTESMQAKIALDALERETMMNRGMRELQLIVMQDLATRQSAQMAEQGIEMSPQDILAEQSAWVKLVAINQRATELRAIINTEGE